MQGSCQAWLAYLFDYRGLEDWRACIGVPWCSHLRPASVRRSTIGDGVWDEKTEEYYLSLFTAEQPDLNWRNPKVREAIWEMMLFWLDRGVDGFRIDSMNLMSKHPDLPDGKVVNDEPFLSWS